MTHVEMPSNLFLSEFQNHSKPLLLMLTMQAWIDKAPAIFGDLWYLVCEIRGVKIPNKDRNVIRWRSNAYRTRQTPCSFSCSLLPAMRTDLFFRIGLSSRTYQILLEGLVHQLKSQHHILRSAYHLQHVSVFSKL